MNFDAAFAEARQANLPLFTWKGKVYTTKVAAPVAPVGVSVPLPQAPSVPTVAPAPLAAPKTGIAENVRGQDIPYDKLSQQRKNQLFAKTKGSSQKTIDFAQSLVPFFNPAIKRAEGNKNNFGVLSEKISSPDDANKILNKSIKNNYRRWAKAGNPGTFVDFLRDRWAPIGVKNDPKNLNVNWNNNVRRGLLDKLGPVEYKKWEDMNLVQTQPEQYSV